jgi:hypothetical protein
MRIVSNESEYQFVNKDYGIAFAEDRTLLWVKLSIYTGY